MLQKNKTDSRIAPVLQRGDLHIKSLEGFRRSLNFIERYLGFSPDRGDGSVDHLGFCTPSVSVGNYAAPLLGPNV